MKRRFGMWIGIICILIVGVSVTRMTKDFVVSKGAAASSMLNVMDEGFSAAALAGGAQADAASENGTAFRMAIPQEAANGAADGQPETGAQPTYAAEVQAGTAASQLTYETVTEEKPESGVEKSETVAGLTSGPGAGSGTDVAAVMEEPETAPDESADVEAVEEEVLVEPAVSGAEAIQETVKSPLDPVIEKKTEGIVEETEGTSYGAADFFERFETAEANSVKLWDSISADNVVAYYAAAEQERVLWDYELNLVYGAIREKMSEKEAEELKHLELEWLKERDQYAERMASKSPIMNSQNQNPVYTRALAEKTKERCYWLVSEYEDVLNRETVVTEKEKKEERIEYKNMGPRK